MPASAATIANLTATGDVIITTTTAINKPARGRPTVNLGSTVTGISPIGIPVSIAVLVCPNVNEIV
jgi:hypothetical protein